MKLVFEIYGFSLKVGIVGCLYIYAVFFTLETLLLGLMGHLPIFEFAKLLLATVIIFIASHSIHKMRPSSFTSPKVFKWLGIFASFGLAFAIISLLDKGFSSTLFSALQKFESSDAVGLIRLIVVGGIGIFFIIGIPLVIVMGFEDSRNLIVKIAANILYWFLYLFILYIIVMYGDGKAETNFVKHFIVPTVELILKCFPLLWFYELFIATIETSNLK
jgi:hypothetical protein